MNSEQLYAFRSVYRNRSFSKASSELGKSQSAVTQLVQNLEKEIGEPLFVRHRRPVMPTEAGDIMIVHAERIIEEYETAVTAIKKRGESLFRLLYRVNRMNRMDRYLQMNYGPGFPEITELALASYRSTDAWEENTLYLVRRSVILSKSISYRKAFDSPVYVAVSARSALAKKETVTLNDLEGKTVVLPSRGSRTPFAQNIFKAISEYPGIRINESDAGFAADLAFVKIRNTVMFCTDELITQTEGIRYLVVSDLPSIEYGFASLHPFTSAMLSFISSFMNWYGKEYENQ